MSKKPLTPDELAKMYHPEKKTYSFNLTVQYVEIIEKMSAKKGIPKSLIVDEALAAYIEFVESGVYSPKQK